MPTTITLKGIPDDLYAQLRASAELNRRSMNSEAIACLEALLLPRKAGPAEHLARARAFRASLARPSFPHADIDRVKRQGRP